MIEPFTVTVDGRPAGQGSKNAFRSASTGRIVTQEVSRYVKPWRDAVEAACRRALTVRTPAWVDGEALTVQIDFLIERPKSHYLSAGRVRPGSPHLVTTAPDLDKLCRSTLDGLQQAGLINDARVAELRARKLYHREGGAMIRIAPLR